MSKEESLSQKVKLKRSQDYERDNDNLRAIINRMEMVRTSMTLIDQLRFEEGSSVLIPCDNGDFNGIPNNKIQVTGSWTNWHPRVFTGESVFVCLDKAFKEMLKAKEKKEGNKVLVPTSGDVKTEDLKEGRAQTDQSIPPHEDVG